MFLPSKIQTLNKKFMHNHTPTLYCRLQLFRVKTEHCRHKCPAGVRAPALRRQNISCCSCGAGRKDKEATKCPIRSGCDIQGCVTGVELMKLTLQCLIRNVPRRLWKAQAAREPAQKSTARNSFPFLSLKYQQVLWFAAVWLQAAVCAGGRCDTRLRSRTRWPWHTGSCRCTSSHGPWHRKTTIFLVIFFSPCVRVRL